MKMKILMLIVIITFAALGCAQQGENVVIKGKNISTREIMSSTNPNSPTEIAFFMHKPAINNDSNFIPPGYEHGESWNLYLSQVLMNDIGQPLSFCKNEKLLFCSAEPYPIFVPKKPSVKSVTMEYYGKTYNIKLLDDAFGELKIEPCKARYFWLVVTSRDSTEKKRRLYLFDYERGLLGIDQYSEELKEPPTELFFKLSRGKIFSLKDKCNNRFGKQVYW